MSDYRDQNRGDHSAYARYLGGMDASMKQKIALTAAHLLGQGKVADMGSGSGSGAHALASLYPSLTVVGVDVDPTMVEMARGKYQLPNLSFVCGDISTECFPAGSLDGIFNSSVLHHVATFSAYDYSAVEAAIEAQVKQLGERGMLIVRDFVDPGEGEVILELAADDGDEGDDPVTCSAAALFRRFAREFRKLSPSPGFPFEELPPADGASRFRVPIKIATEFVLRKDYRRDWETEILEEYTYFSQRRFETLFSRLGLRIITSTPLWNRWIVRNRFEGKSRFFSTDGLLLDYPPTNYVIVGEKVPPAEGVRFVERSSDTTPSFLSMNHYRDVASGAVRDLVRRPHPTIDVIPWFERESDVFVLARKGYPRPILGCRQDDAVNLDLSFSGHYVTEPLNTLQSDEPLGRMVEQMLGRFASISPGQIRSFRTGCGYYPSPGGTEEEARSSLVEIDPLFVQSKIENLSGFSTSGQVRAIETTQLLRAAQVGGLPDTRLELNVYELLEQLDRDPGPWIGETIELSDTPATPAEEWTHVRARPPRRRFVPADESSSPGFLELRRSMFDECAADGSVVASGELEYVVPRTLSVTTIALALLRLSGGRTLIGIDDDDLPAAQSFNGNSAILVAPAWRLPKRIESRRDALAWIGERLREEYGLEAVRFSELGGKYVPSGGVTPETVFPFAAEVRISGEGDRPLIWLDLAETIENRDALVDCHLRTVTFRAAHALGLLSRTPETP